MTIILEHLLVLLYVMEFLTIQGAIDGGVMTKCHEVKGSVKPKIQRARFLALKMKQNNVKKVYAKTFRLKSVC